MFGSVPLAKVMEIDADPELPAEEEKYKRPSRPVICCSRTWMTLDSSVSADAPGYTAPTLICGGATLGYCATGSVVIAATPASMIAMAMTHAKIGRWTKKWLMAVAQPPSFAGTGLTTAPGLILFRPSTTSRSPAFRPERHEPFVTQSAVSNDVSLNHAIASVEDHCGRVAVRSPGNALLGRKHRVAHCPLYDLDAHEHARQQHADRGSGTSPAKVTAPVLWSTVTSENSILPVLG